MNRRTAASSSPWALTKTTAQDGGNPISTAYFGDHYNKLYRSEEQTMRFVFRDFERLGQELGDNISSDSIRCHGHLWSVRLFPGGDRWSDHIAAFLELNRNEGDGDCDSKVRASFKFRFPTVRFDLKKQESRCDFTFRNTCGDSELAFRDDVLDPSNNYLVDGDLTIDVDIRVWRKCPELWTPPNETFQMDMLHILKSGKYADVTFIVQGAKFPVHRTILASRAPTLEEFCRGHPPNAEIEIESDKIDPIAFRLLLCFVYGNILPTAYEFRVNARALLCAANFCGCTTLKRATESILVESLSVDNAAELLVLADANCCALLKEAATDVFLANPTKVRGSSGWTYVKESNELMDYLVEAMYSGMSDPGEEVNLDRMSVTTLRRKLDELGLDADGSKDCLIKRLRGEQTGAD